MELTRYYGQLFTKRGSTPGSSFQPHPNPSRLVAYGFGWSIVLSASPFFTAFAFFAAGAASVTVVPGFA
jgi:hypothetical protein